MNDLPKSILDYLDNIDYVGECPDYVKFDFDCMFVEWGGNLTSNGMACLKHAQLSIMDFPFLEGLLPLEKNPLVLPNMQLRSGCYIDLHLFKNKIAQWVLLFECTQRAREEQTAQQKRLNQKLNAQRDA